jgi:hypothetical protein
MPRYFSDDDYDYDEEWVLAAEEVFDKLKALLTEFNVNFEVWTGHVICRIKKKKTKQSWDGCQTAMGSGQCTYLIGRFSDTRMAPSASWFMKSVSPGTWLAKGLSMKQPEWHCKL